MLSSFLRHSIVILLDSKNYDDLWAQADSGGAYQIKI